MGWAGLDLWTAAGQREVRLGEWDGWLACDG